MSGEERAEMPDIETERADRFLRRRFRALLSLGIAPVITAALPAFAGQMTVQTIAPEQLTATVGQHLQGPDGSDAGRLWEVLVDRTGQPRAAVIEYGGFAGVGRRKVAVAWPALHFRPGDRKHPITLLLDRAEVGRIPDFNSAAGSITFGAPGLGADTGGGQ
jgi:hypothetical protein